MNLLDIVGPLKKVGANEHHGACPWCGGKDRFVVWPDQSFQPSIQAPIGRYFCRQCGRTGDGIDFLRQHVGLSFPDACGRFGIRTNQYEAEWRAASNHQAEVSEESYQFRSWVLAPSEYILSGLSEAFKDGDNELFNDLLSVLRERLKSLLIIAQRYNERHGKQLDTFIYTETGLSLQDMFAELGIRPIAKSQATDRLKVFRPIPEPEEYEIKKN